MRMWWCRARLGRASSQGAVLLGSAPSSCSMTSSTRLHPCAQGSFFFPPFSCKRGRRRALCRTEPRRFTHTTERSRTDNKRQHNNALQEPQPGAQSLLRPIAMTVTHLKRDSQEGPFAMTVSPSRRDGQAGGGYTLLQPTRDLATPHSRQCSAIVHSAADTWCRPTVPAHLI